MNGEVSSEFNNSPELSSTVKLLVNPQGDYYREEGEVVDN